MTTRTKDIFSNTFVPDRVVLGLGPEVRVYMVGGAVRDLLMGKELEDRDWVVVGANPALMLSAGFLPVGQDFPVFLHPITHEEYALARTERKTSPGYKGFVFHTDEKVTLEQDLERRDLTINAIAIDQTGRMIDPFHGQRDIENKVLRHVSDAFKEDPVRILRLARFAARLHLNGEYFSVATETMQLCREMVAQGEVDALVAERVWQELARGLVASSPMRMLDVLIRCNALNHIVSAEVAGFITHKSVLDELDQVCSMSNDLSTRWALWWGLIQRECDSPRVISAHQIACKRWRVPNEVRDLAAVVIKLATAVASAVSFDEVTACFEHADAFRKPERWQRALDVISKLNSLALHTDRWNQALLRLFELDLEPIVEKARRDNNSIPEVVAKARRAWLANIPPI